MSSTVTCADSKFDPATLTVEKTLENIAATIKPITTVKHVLLLEALNHVLAEDITSPMQVPPHRNSAMDGYAFNHADMNINNPVLNLVGVSFAGKPYGRKVNPTECIRIMTGAVMPEGADTVVMQEHVNVTDEQISLQKIPAKGANVRYPGEDIQTGDVILNKGTQITPADLGLLSSIGINKVSVYRKPVIAFFSTGDELKGVGDTLLEGDIYDSNRYTLHGMLSNMGVDLLDLGIIKDDKETLKNAMLDASQRADLVLTSGGASVGDADYINEILNEIGEVSFWKIAMKPGKPLAFGLINNIPYFGLPGNPVSVMATCYLFVQPAIKLLKGLKIDDAVTLKARLRSDIRKTPGRKDFQRGIYQMNAQGELEVSTTGTQGSHILTSMSLANCFIVLPQESADICQGEIVEIMPFNEIL